MDPEFASAMDAARTGNLDRLRALLREDPSLATRRSARSHPSLLQFIAVDGGLGQLPDAPGAARVLIEAGAELEAPFVAAASVGSVELLATMREAGCPVEAGAPWTAAEEANYWGHRDAVAWLRARGAALRSLRLAAGCEALEVMEAMMPDGVLAPAAGPVRCPFADCVDTALASTPQAILDQAFLIAVLNRREGAARWLLQHGASIDAMPTGTHWRATALHACMDRRVPMVDWLLAEGADPTLRDPRHDATPADWARHHDQPEVGAVLDAAAAQWSSR